MSTLRSDRVRVSLLAGTMVASAVLFVVTPLFAINEPDQGRALVDAVDAQRVRFFFSTFFFGIASVTAGIAGIGFMMLTRRRGHVLGTIGGSLMLVGGIAFGAAISAYGTAFYVATENRVGIDAAVRLDSAAQDAALTGIPWLTGFLGTTIGILLVTIALLRARTTPLWVPIVLILGTVLMFVVSRGSAWDALVNVPFAVALCGAAWVLFTRDLGAPTPAAETPAAAQVTPPGQHRRVEPAADPTEHGRSTP